MSRELLTREELEQKKAAQVQYNANGTTTEEKNDRSIVPPAVVQPEPQVQPTTVTPQATEQGVQSGQVENVAVQPVQVAPAPQIQPQPVQAQQPQQEIVQAQDNQGTPNAETEVGEKNNIATDNQQVTNTQANVPYYKANNLENQFAEEVKSWGLNGNVDHLNRPMVDAETMRKAGYTKKNGYDIPDGATATIFSMRYGDGKNNVVMTPILADGEVRSPEQMDAYINKLYEVSAKTGKSVLELDKMTGNLIVGTNVPEGMEEKIHQAHGRYYLGELRPDEYGERLKLQGASYGKKLLREWKADIEQKLGGNAPDAWTASALKSIDEMLADPNISEYPLFNMSAGFGAPSGGNASANGNGTPANTAADVKSGTPTNTGTQSGGNITTDGTKEPASTTQTPSLVEQYKKRFTDKKYDAKTLQDIVDKNKGKTDANSVAGMQAAQELLAQMGTPSSTVTNNNTGGTTNNTTTNNNGYVTLQSPWDGRNAVDKLTLNPGGAAGTEDDSQKVGTADDGLPELDGYELGNAEKGDMTLDPEYRKRRDDVDAKKKAYDERRDFWNNPENDPDKTLSASLYDKLKEEGLDAESEERRKKRDRVNRLIANIGDVLQGFANLAGTAYGADSSNLTSLSAAVDKSRGEESVIRQKRRAEIEKNHKENVAAIQKKAEKEIKELHDDWYKANERLEKYLDDMAKENRRAENNRKLQEQRAQDAKTARDENVQNQKDLIDYRNQASQQTHQVNRTFDINNPLPSRASSGSSSGGKGNGKSNGNKAKTPKGKQIITRQAPQPKKK